MAAESTFDIVSEFSQQELANAVDQTTREIHTRFDLKDSATTLELTKTELIITTSAELFLTSIRDILESKAIRRSLSLKIFSYGKPEDITNGRVRQVVTLQKGINVELAKKIQKLIRDQFPKIQPRIQGEALRVGSKNRDDLQDVIRFLKEKEPEFPVPLQFINYR